MKPREDRLLKRRRPSAKPAPPQEPVVPSPAPPEPVQAGPSIEEMRKRAGLDKPASGMDDYGTLGSRPKRPKKYRDPEAPKPPPKPPKPKREWPPWHGLEEPRAVRQLPGGLKVWIFDKAGKEHRVFVAAAGDKITEWRLWRSKEPQVKRMPIKASASCRTCQSEVCEACHYAIALLDPTHKPI